MRFLLVTNCDFKEGQILKSGPDTEDQSLPRVYAYQYNDCLYESSFYVVSLHATKAGAYRAKQKAQWAQELEALEQNRKHDREIARDAKIPLRKDSHWRRVNDSTAHRIVEFVIQP